jgi:uncharacterized protein YfbU (UPF0304 family)
MAWKVCETCCLSPSITRIPLPPETEEKINGLALTHQSRVLNYLKFLLKANGIHVSFVTIQKILDREGQWTRYDRWLAIKKHQAE